MRTFAIAAAAVSLVAMTGVPLAQVERFVPVTQEMLHEPEPRRLAAVQPDV